MSSRWSTWPRRRRAPDPRQAIGHVVAEKEALVRPRGHGAPAVDDRLHIHRGHDIAVRRESSPLISCGVRRHARRGARATASDSVIPHPRHDTTRSLHDHPPRSPMTATRPRAIGSAVVGRLTSLGGEMSSRRVHKPTNAPHKRAPQTRPTNAPHTFAPTDALAVVCGLMRLLNAASDADATAVSLGGAA
jgi:hypothetical protein